MDIYRYASCQYHKLLLKYASDLENYFYLTQMGLVIMRTPEKLETATRTLEKEALFYDSLLKAEVSARIANRLLSFILLFKLMEGDLPLYLSDKATELFSYKPQETAKALVVLLEEITRYVRLSVYLGIKGVFPQAVSVLRNAVEIIGVYTHIWHEPQKLDVAHNSDSKEYARAFRWTEDKKLDTELKAKGIQYRFYHCDDAKRMSEFYKLLSGQFVHTASLNTVGLPAIVSEDLSCYLIDRVLPESLELQYRRMQEILTNIYIEIIKCIPSNDILHTKLVDTMFLSITLLPALSTHHEKPSDEVSELVRQLFEFVHNSAGKDNLG